VSPAAELVGGGFYQNKAMSDKEFEKLIQQAASLARQHRFLVEKAEKEYERRFGKNPSDVDDDFWIDCVHQGIGVPSVQDVIENAKLHQ
jgi:hypothetical protein